MEKEKPFFQMGQDLTFIPKLWPPRILPRTVASTEEDEDRSGPPSLFQRDRLLLDKRSHCLAVDLTAVTLKGLDKDPTRIIQPVAENLLQRGIVTVLSLTSRRPGMMIEMWDVCHPCLYKSSFTAYQNYKHGLAQTPVPPLVV